MSYQESSERQNLINQIIHFEKLNRFEKARLIASDLIRKYPESPYGYYHMSSCEFYLNKIDNAIELCIKSLELGMSQLAVSIMLMFYYNEKNDYANVDLQFNLLKTIAPNNTDVLGIYGYSLCKRGNMEEGVQLLEDAFAKDPNNSTIIDYLFTSTRKNKKRKKENEALLKVYMDSNASEIQKLIFAGRYEINMRKWRKANKIFEKVIGMDPLNREVLQYLKFIELKTKAMPLLLVFSMVLTFVVYRIKFDPNRILTYGYFLPSLIMLIVYIIGQYGFRKL